MQIQKTHYRSSLPQEQEWLSKKCIEEKIIPKCTIKSYNLSHHIFLRRIQEYLEASKTLLNHEATALVHATNQLSLELHKHHNFTNKNSKKCQPYPFYKTAKQTLPPPGWKQVEPHWTPKMVLNLTHFQFSTTEMEALSLGLKFATGIYKTSP